MSGHGKSHNINDLNNHNIPISIKSANYIMASTDFHIVIDASSASVAVDMDSVDDAVNDGQIWIITCEDKTNSATVTSTKGFYGGGLSGGNTFTFGSQYDSITLTYDNTKGGFRII